MERHDGNVATSRDRHRRHGDLLYSTAYRCGRLHTALHAHQVSRQDNRQLGRETHGRNLPQSVLHLSSASAVDRQQHLHAAVSTVRLDSDRRVSPAGGRVALRLGQVGVPSRHVGQQRRVLAAVPSERANARRQLHGGAGSHRATG